MIIVRSSVHLPALFMALDNSKFPGEDFHKNDIWIRQRKIPFDFQIYRLYIFTEIWDAEFFFILVR